MLDNLNETDRENALTRKQLFFKVCQELGDQILVIRIEGCANMLGFRSHISEKLCLVQDPDEEISKNIYEICRQIIGEAKKNKKKQQHYDLGQFDVERAINDTSPTLLKLVATLCNQGCETYSNERVSLSLAQAIQYKINHIPNQTTLGIGVRMHHRFGSKELISHLSSYGICVSYDEVLRFRQSAAYYTRNQEILSGNLRPNHRRVQRGGSGGPDPPLFLDPPLFICDPPLQPNPISQTNVM